jgi:hypothetical protein
MAELKDGYLIPSPEQAERMWKIATDGAKLWADYLGVPHTSEARLYTQHEDSRAALRDKGLEEIAESIGTPTELWHSPNFACMFVADKEGRIFRIRAGDVISMGFNNRREVADKFDLAMMELRRRVDPTRTEIHFFYRDAEDRPIYSWNLE